MEPKTSVARAPSWEHINVRVNVLRQRADTVGKRAEQIGDLGGDVSPLKQVVRVGRLDDRSRGDRLALWAYLDRLEAGLRDYESHLSVCERELAEKAAEDWTRLLIP